jgi:hypothetical protein
MQKWFKHSTSLSQALMQKWFKHSTSLSKAHFWVHSKEIHPNLPSHKLPPPILI